MIAINNLQANIVIFEIYQYFYDMKISVYRVYPRGASANPDIQHLFSKVTTDEGAQYATPNNNSEWEGFDNKRIEHALNMEDTRPVTSLDWALVASRNMSMLDVIQAEVLYNSIDEAVTNEQKIAEQAWLKRKGSEI